MCCLRCISFTLNTICDKFCDNCDPYYIFIMTSWCGMKIMFTRFQHFMALQLLIPIVTVAVAFSLVRAIHFYGVLTPLNRLSDTNYINIVIFCSLFPFTPSPRFLFPSCIHQHLPPSPFSFIIYSCSSSFPSFWPMLICFLSSPYRPTPKTQKDFCAIESILQLIINIIIIHQLYALCCRTSPFWRCASFIYNAFYFIYKILKLWKIRMQTA